MKGRNGLILFCLLMAAALCGCGEFTAFQESKGTGPVVVRNVKWGMSRRAVQEAEGLTSNSRQGAYLVRTGTQVAGLDADVYYKFNDSGGCSLVMYLFTHERDSEQAYVEDFNLLKGMLAEKYGDPARNHKIWTDVTYKDMPEMHGYAIAQGHASWLVNFYTEESDIRLFMYGTRGKPCLSIQYRTKEVPQPEIEPAPENVL